MFYGNSFIFDGVASEMFNLYLGQIGDSGESMTSGSDVSLTTQKIYRRPTPFIYGAEQTPVLSFPLSVYVPGEMVAPHYSAIAGWLWGQSKYKILRICQEDIQEVYFNVFLTAPEITRVGNIIRAFRTTVVCDSPWGYKEAQRYTSPTYSGQVMSDEFTFYNDSDNSAYTYPRELKIIANAYGGTVTITNITDSNRVFTLTDLLPNEIITINCDLQIMTSDLVTYPLYKFTTKNWLRLVRGGNSLSVSGNISNFYITTYPTPVKIG